MTRNYLTLLLLCVALTSCSSYVLRPPDDDKWKCISAVHVQNVANKIKITQTKKLVKGEHVEVRLVRTIPFQDLETLPERRGLDAIIREKGCAELAVFFNGLPTMPITYLDYGPLDLSPKNSSRMFLVPTSYELLVRTNSPKAKILIKPIK